MEYTDEEINKLLEESQWQIDGFDRPSAHNSKLMIDVIKYLQTKLNNHVVLDNVSKCCKCGKNKAKGKTNQCDSCLLDGII
jgi:hypothetical protein